MNLPVDQAFKVAIFRALLVASVMCCAPGLVLGGQEESADSPRELAAVKAIEEAGGKVYKISAEDESHEISFYLSATPVEDVHMKDLGVIREVIWLNLAGTKVTDNGLKQISMLPLKKLHLEKTGIGDAGLVHLKSLKDLEYLNLYATKVTDAGLENLKGLTHLKRLYVWQSGVTEAGIKRLKESLPNLKIVGEVKWTPVVVEKPKKKEVKKKEVKKEEVKKEEVKKEEVKKEEVKKEEVKKEEVKKEEAKKEEAKKEDENPVD